MRLRLQNFILGALGIFMLTPNNHCYNLISKGDQCQLPPSVESNIKEMESKHRILSWQIDINSCGILHTRAIKHGKPDHALILCQKIKQESFACISARTIVASLKACAQLKDLEKGLDIHAHILGIGLLEENHVIGNSLLNMYAKCGSFGKAKQVFGKILNRNVVSWTALISGHTEYGHDLEALSFLERMRLEGIVPNSVTFVSCLKACTNLGAIIKGKMLQIEIEAQGLSDNNLFVGSALVDMYAKNGDFEGAQEAFHIFPTRNEVMWNTLITRFVKHDYNDKALTCFEQMQVQGILQTTVTIISILKVYGNIKAIDKVVAIHAQIENQGLLENNIIVGSTLVDMYAKCGSFARAHQVFDKLLDRNVVLWTTLISRSSEYGHFEAALNYFEQMQLEGIPPNSVTLICILKACGYIGAKEKGREIHREIERQGLVRREYAVGNALVDMYAKCGSVVSAKQVFDKLPIRTIVSWTVLMAGYAQVGDILNVIMIFERMVGEHIKPNLVTFVVLLRACSRTGLFHKSQTYFQLMSKDYGIVPTLKHHTWMVDVCGRAGKFDIAVAMIRKIPFGADQIVWKNLLGACRSWGNANLGKQVFQHSVNSSYENDAVLIHQDPKVLCLS